jgi:glyoxylase-like metal-dependent hydrolase (beta-lactamase superfamily II)
VGVGQKSWDGAADAAPDRREWERPGAFQVVPGVFRIPLEMPDDGLKAVNVYAVVDGDRLVMIDSGWALDGSRRQLESALAGIGHDLSSISRFLVTHAHVDHYTQAVVIRGMLGTEVLVGADEASTIAQVRTQEPDSLMDLDRQLLAAGADRATVLAMAKKRLAETPVEHWEDPDGWLRNGMAIETRGRVLRIIATPGHTRGHVVVHDAEHGLLFTGDHVLPHITPSIGYEAAAVRSPLSDYLRSLNIVEALGDCRMLPAHGPVAPSTQRRIAELRDHHARRLDVTEGALRTGASTAWQVAEVLTWTSKARAFQELDVFNQFLAANETLAHLRLLAERGRVQDARVGGVDHFTP